MPTWKNLTFLPPRSARQACDDPETRAKMQADWDEPRKMLMHRRWDLIADLQGGSSRRMRVSWARAWPRWPRCADSIRWMRSWIVSLEEDLQTTFKTSNARDDSEAMGAVLNSPYILIGVSDAGAHVQFGVDFGYATRLLHTLGPRARCRAAGARPIHKLTFQVASIYGLQDRGLLRPGYAADVTIFDLDTVQALPAEWATGLPGRHKPPDPALGGRSLHDRQRRGDLRERQPERRLCPGSVIRGAAYAGAGARELVGAR